MFLTPHTYTHTAVVLALFRLLDFNGDGKVELQEFAAGLKVCAVFCLLYFVYCLVLSCFDLS
jgi:hypothetical protein